MPQRSSNVLPSTFPFVALPFELRLEIYRHAFSIYPSIRVCATYAALVPEGQPMKIFEVISHFNPPITRGSSTPPTRFMSDEEQQRRGEYRYPCQSFLSILLVSRAIYEEAMPLYYSETFFVLPCDMWPAIRFLKGIGARRRKHIRRLRVQFYSSEIGELMGGDGDMRMLVDQLVDAERVDTLEIVLPKVSELSILNNVRRRSRTSYCLSPSSRLESYLGFTQLKRLKSLRLLRLVGRWMALPLDREGMLQRLETESLGEEGPHRPTVEFVLRDQIGRYKYG